MLHEFVDPVSQHGALGRLDDGPFDVAVTVAYKPGVTDPVGKSARRLRRGHARPEARGRRRGLHVDDVPPGGRRRRPRPSGSRAELLANPVIQTIRIDGYDAWRKAAVDLSVPKIAAHAHRAGRSPSICPGRTTPLLALSKPELLALTLAEMKAVRDHFREASQTGGASRPGSARPRPTSSSSASRRRGASTASTRSSTRPSRTASRESAGDDPLALQDVHPRRDGGRGPGDARRLGARGWCRSSTTTRASSPSTTATTSSTRSRRTTRRRRSIRTAARSPGSSASIATRSAPGAAPSCSPTSGATASRSPFYEGARPAGLLHPRRIRDGVHRGVIDGGNQSGVPYGRGFEIFDARFLGKPLVFCGTVGRLPVTIAGTPGERRRVTPGDRIVMVGGRIGADGIHGATFSSAALDESAPDPGRADRRSDHAEADVRLPDRGARPRPLRIDHRQRRGRPVVLGRRDGEGLGRGELDLAKAPLKYAGLAPWEIFLSEAQERMTLAVPEGDVAAFSSWRGAARSRRRCSATFTDSGSLEHRLRRRDGRPCSTWSSSTRGPRSRPVPRCGSPGRFAEPAGPAPTDLDATLLAMLARLNLCSNESEGAGTTTTRSRG